MLRFCLSFLTTCLLVGCATHEDVKRSDITGLTQQITALGPDVDPAEASRVATIAHSYPLELKTAYGVTDLPLIHNAKVNQGLRRRGLCWHWADDLETRLKQEGLKTLQLHRAIANADNLRIQHSSVIVSAQGETIKEGVVLDPWRFGGYLFWSPTIDDERYVWVSRRTVFEERRARD